MRKLNGLWIGKLGNSNFWYHCFPFASCDLTGQIHVVRGSKGDKVISNTVYHLFRSRNRILDLVTAFFVAYKVIRKNNIDYVINFNPAPWGIIAWFVAKVSNKPIILGFIGSDLNIRMNNPFYKHMVSFIAKRSEIITVTGNTMKEKLLDIIKLDPNRVHVYPHCVSDIWLEQVEQQKPEYDLITVGRLIELKRVSDIIKALSIIHKQGLKLSLAILGDGIEKENLISLSHKLGLQDYIHFLGYQNNVLDYLRMARFYIQASRAEGLSLSLIEAFATGIVPVATKAGCESDLIQDGITGRLVEIGNPNILAEAILSLNPERNYNKIRNNILKQRKKLGVSYAIDVCNNLLKEVTNSALRS